MSQLQLKFGSYDCQVAEDVTPCNSLAACMRGAISMRLSGNLSGGQRFLALDTSKLIVRNHWKELPMPFGCYQPCQRAWSCQMVNVSVY